MAIKSMDVHPRRYYLKSERRQEKLNEIFLEHCCLMLAQNELVGKQENCPRKRARLSQIVDEDRVVASPLSSRSVDSGSRKSSPYDVISPRSGETSDSPSSVFRMKKSKTLNTVEELKKPMSFWSKLKLRWKSADNQHASKAASQGSSRAASSPGLDKTPKSRPSSLTFKFLSDSKLQASFKSLLSFRSSRSQSTESPATNTSSHSLNDGRIPWPVPWLEALFLPEFPNRGHLNDKQFHNDGIIAHGKFSTVYRVTLKVNPESKFAMKVQRKSDILSQNAVEQVKDELRIHQAFCNHPLIAQVYGSWQSRSHLYMILQHVSGYGDMYEYWRFENPLPPMLVKLWAAELGSTLDFMHKKGVIYRDLKMENILLDDRAHIKIIDFGLAKWLKYGEQTKTICGTLHYIAPEILTGLGYSHSADWWSLGVLLHTLVSGRYPFEVTEQNSVKHHIGYRPPKNVPTDLQQLLIKLLRFDPLKRLAQLNALLREPYFEDVPFHALLSGTLSPSDEIFKYKAESIKRYDACEDITMDEECIDDYMENYSAFLCFDYEDTSGKDLCSC